MIDPVQKDYDFTGKDPNAILSKDELDHFDEGMQIKNSPSYISSIDFMKAVQSVIQDMDKLLS